MLNMKLIHRSDAILHYPHKFPDPPVVPSVSNLAEN